MGDLVEAYDLKNLQVTTSELSNIETCNSIMTFIELDPCFVTPVASQNIGSASDGHIGASFEKLS